MSPAATRLPSALPANAVRASPHFPSKRSRESAVGSAVAVAHPSRQRGVGAALLRNFWKALRFSRRRPVAFSCRSLPFRFFPRAFAKRYETLPFFPSVFLLKGF